MKRRRRLRNGKANSGCRKRTLRCLVVWSSMSLSMNRLLPFLYTQK